MKFKVEVVETLCKIVDVEADTSQEAEDIVRKLYRNQEIILDAEDYFDVDFKARRYEHVK